MSSAIMTLFNKKNGENKLVRLEMGSILVKGFPIEVEIVTDEDLKHKRNYYYSSIAKFAKEWEFAECPSLEGNYDNQN